MKYLKITDYKSYREFLRDYYNIRKSQDPKFSYRYFTRKAGINSSGLYSNLVTGSKNLTVNSGKKFAIALDLNEKELEYFLLMIEWTHSQNHEHKEDLEEDMASFWPKGIRRYHFAQKQFFSTWKHSAILQALHIIEVKDDFAPICEFLRSKVNIDEVTESFELLLELEMVKIHDTGFYKPTHQTGVAGKEVGVRTIREFQKIFMTLGQEALDTIQPPERHIVSNTLSASNESLELIKKKVQKLQNDIHDIVQQETETDQVFQLNIQFFPLSEGR